MKALIIYDSYFGNTENIAKAIQKVLEKDNTVTLSNVNDYEPKLLENIELLFVGSPTRAFSPTEQITKFLKELPKESLTGVKVASFDTRVDIEKVKSKILTFLVNLFGYAAEPILKKLVKKGGEAILPPQGFFVEESEGPLSQGEIERVKNWIEDMKI